MDVLNLVMKMIEEMNVNVDRHLTKVIVGSGLNLEDYKNAFNKHYSVQMTTKYLKVWYESAGNKSIVMFVNKEGDILKPESHKKPAKGIRGNIKDWKSAVKLDINNTLILF